MFRSFPSRLGELSLLALNHVVQPRDIYVIAGRDRLLSTEPQKRDVANLEWIGIREFDADRIVEIGVGAPVWTSGVDTRRKAIGPE